MHDSDRNATLARPRIGAYPIVLLMAFAAAWMTASGSASAAPFYMGGDVSLLPFIESRGGQFKDNGVVRPMERIMANHGANLFRLRLFVNPNTNYEATGGAIQDLDYAIALAQRLKASVPNAKLLLDLHYSDTWADPANQTKPSAWSALSYNALRTQVQSYTQQTLVAFKNAGVMPEMVQVGNEIAQGMLWQDGRLNFSANGGTQQSWRNLGGLLNSAIAGVRAAQGAGPRVEVAIHLNNGENDSQWFFDRLENASYGNVTDYDVMGVSFYPGSAAEFTGLQNNLSGLASDFEKRIMLLEFNYKWRSSGGGTYGGYALAEAGQAEALARVRDMMLDLPDEKGMGVVWWYPEAIQAPNTSIFRGGSIALFDSDGESLDALDEFAVPEPAAGCLVLLTPLLATRGRR